MDLGEMWQAVLKRDAAYDGAFVYAVRSTGIYCRPSCPARRPSSQEAVEFFRTGDAAERSGYRACLRCRPSEPLDPWQRNLRLIQLACTVLERCDRSEQPPPSLAELAQECGGVSALTLQKTFRRILGVSPKEYAQAVADRRFRAMLRRGERVGVAARETGRSSPGSRYGRPSADLGLSPSSYRRGGAGVTIRFATVPCPLGWILLAATDQGVCSIQIGGDAAVLEESLRNEFPQAALVSSADSLGPFLLAALSALGLDREASQAVLNLPLDVRSTSFQQRVWLALRRIPRGGTRSYSQIAAGLGHSSAARAVGTACATNPVALAIPCHRAVRSDGSISDYRWGRERKESLLNWEADAAEREEGLAEEK